MHEVLASVSGAGQSGCAQHSLLLVPHFIMAKSVEALELWSFKLRATRSLMGSAAGEAGQAFCFGDKVLLWPLGD